MIERLQNLVLVPGLLCDERLWAAQTHGLAASAHVIVPDLTAYESVESMADGVLDLVPGDFSLAGFSLGGCVALEIVARAPQRVRRLALLSTSPSGISPAVRKHYLASMASIEAGGLDDYLAHAFPLYVAPQRAQDRALWEIFAAMGRSLGPDVAVRQMRSLLAYGGFGVDLGKIACPAAVICGREDHRVPVAVHEELGKRIPKARLRVIERAGHFTPLEEPQAVTDELLRWLERKMQAGEET